LNTQEHDALEINTVFNGEFVMDDKRANKSIKKTINSFELFSDLREWYVSSLP